MSAKKKILKRDVLGKKIPKIKMPAIRLRYRLLLYVLTILFVTLSLVQVVAEVFGDIMGFAVYAAAAITLFASCYYLAVDMRYGVKDIVKPGIEANPFTNRVATDYRYRTVLFAVPGLALNMVFAIFNGVVGMISGSAWFGSLSAYYIILSIMRFSAVRYDRRVSKMEQTKEVLLDEISVYRKCGILFIVMTAALSGTVVLLTKSLGGKHYPGYTIYAVAAYTFYKIIISIVNLVKAGKLKAPFLVAIRNIGYIDACVSILSLQTAMLAAFGNGQEELEKMLNGLTGTVVCIMVLVMGIRCIYVAAKMKRALLEKGGTDND